MWIMIRITGAKQDKYEEKEQSVGKKIKRVWSVLAVTECAPAPAFLGVKHLA
jgi:hypothetical protein